MAAKEDRANLRILLVGKTGSGKSAAGNTILGREAFDAEVSPESVTKECQIGEVMLEGKTISVTDTPCVCDKELTEEALTDAFKSCIKMTVPGSHVFLLVIRAGVRYHREEDDAMKWINGRLGIEALRYALVLFTHTDELNGKPLQQYVDKCNELKQLISDCGGRFHGFNNNDKNPDQVTELLLKIEDMVERNRKRGREYYTNDMYETPQEQIEYARRGEKAKKQIDAIDIALGVTSAAGAVTAVIGVTKLLACPGLIGVGSVAAVGGGVALLGKIYYEHRQRNDHRKNK